MSKDTTISITVPTEWASELRMEAGHRGMTLVHYLEHVIRYRHQLPEMTLRLHPEQLASQERVADALEQIVVSYGTQMKLLERSVKANEAIVASMTPHDPVEATAPTEEPEDDQVIKRPFIERPWLRMSPHAQNLMRELYDNWDHFYTDEIEMDALAEKHHVPNWKRVFWGLEQRGLIHIDRIKPKSPNMRWHVAWTFMTNGFKQC